MRVHHQRRVGVRYAVEDGVIRDKIRAKLNARQLDGVAYTFCPDKGTHERPVRMADMGIKHIEMAFIRGQLDRLTHHAAGMVQPWQGLVPFDEGLEVFVTRIAPAFVLIVNKGRPPS